MTRTTIAVVQARMSSQRLPGKVLAELSSGEGEPETVLDWVVQRVARATSVSKVVVATSTDDTDQPLVEHCEARGIATFRGSLDDVLDRVHAAARAHGAETVVRITADCPLIDPGIIDSVVEQHFATGADFTANRLPPPAARTFPVGLDVEVAQFEAVDHAWRTARERHHREHVMPFLYEVPGRFKVTIVDAPVDAGGVRWTIDTPEDLHAVRELIRVAHADVSTPWRELLAQWEGHPELEALNSHVAQRQGTDVDSRTTR